MAFPLSADRMTSSFQLLISFTAFRCSFVILSSGSFELLRIPQTRICRSSASSFGSFLAVSCSESSPFLKIETFQKPPKLLTVQAFPAETPFMPGKRLRRSYGDSVYSCFFDLARSFDTVEFCVLLVHLFDAGINGKCWRLIKHWYCNVTSK